NMEFHEAYRSDAHISDEELLLAIDGELEDQEAAAQIERHVRACWACRARRQEIEDAIAVYVRVHQRNLDSRIPPAAGPRALLKARLAQMPAPPPSRLPPLWLQIAAVAVIAALATVIAGHWNLLGSALRRTSPRQAAFAVPNAALTPGATILTSRNQV